MGILATINGIAYCMCRRTLHTQTFGARAYQQPNEYFFSLHWPSSLQTKERENSCPLGQKLKFMRLLINANEIDSNRFSAIEDIDMEMGQPYVVIQYTYITYNNNVNDADPITLSTYCTASAANQTSSKRKRNIGARETQTLSIAE